LKSHTRLDSRQRLQLLLEKLVNASILIEVELTRTFPDRPAHRLRRQEMFQRCKIVLIGAASHHLREVQDCYSFYVAKTEYLK